MTEHPPPAQDGDLAERLLQLVERAEVALPYEKPQLQQQIREVRAKIDAIGRTRLREGRGCNEPTTRPLRTRRRQHGKPTQIIQASRRSADSR